MVIDITNIESLIKGYIKTQLRQAYPTLDTSDNSPFDNLFVEPSLAAIKPLIEYISQIEIMSNLDNAPYMTPEELDKIGTGNYLTQRKSGTAASTTLTLSFANILPDDTIVIPAGTIFETGGGLQFQTQSRLTFDYLQLLSNYNQESMVYQIDIPVQAVNIGTEYNVDVGTITKCITPFNNNLVTVTNQSAVTNGTDEEDNISYANRIRAFYTSRQLGTKPGYKAFIQESFPEVSDLYVAGYGDPFMQRDLLKVWNDDTNQIEERHVGGKVDIYIKGSVYEQSYTEFVSNSNNIVLPVDYDDLQPGSLRVINNTDGTKNPVIKSITKVESGTYANKVRVILENDSEQSYNPEIVSSMTARYNYINRNTEEVASGIHNFNIGVTSAVLDSPYKDMVSISNTDIGTLNSGISDKYTISQSGIIGTTQEVTTITIKESFADTIVNGSTIRVDYIINHTLKGLGDIFSQEQFRIVTTDILCMEAHQAFVNIQFRVKLADNALVDDIIKNRIQNSIITFFDNYKLGDEIQESDIVAWLYKDERVNYLIQYIALPFDAFYIPESPAAPLELIRSGDSVLNIDAISYPVLNTTRFNVLSV